MAGMLAPGNVSSYNVAPGVLPGEMDMRRRIALALLQQGTDASPVQHWAQGAARMAQSALGGYQLHQANQEDQAQRAASSQAILDSLGPDTAQSASAPQPNPVAAALGPQAPAPEATGGPGPVAAALGSRPEVQPTTKVWGDKEAEAAGLYEPTGGPTRVAQALNPQQPPVLPVQSPSPTPVPNEAAGLKAKVARLLQSGPAGAALAQQLIADFNKRQTEHLANAVSPLSPQETKQYPGAVQKDANGKLIYPPPSTNISLNTEKKGQEELASKSVAAYVDAQTASRESQKRIGQYDQMEKHAKAFTPGASAEMKLGAKRWLRDAGLIEGNDVPDAEAFKLLQSQLAIHAQPKGQGAVSNFERDMFSKSIPNMTMSPEGLTKAISISRSLEQFDMKVAQIFRDSARKNGGIPNYLDVQDQISALGSPLTDAQMGAIRKAQEAPATSTSAAPVTAPGGGKIRTYNPATGKIE